jgi:hypothetical protein
MAAADSPRQAVAIGCSVAEAPDSVASVAIGPETDNYT